MFAKGTQRAYLFLYNICFIRAFITLEHRDIP